MKLGEEATARIQRFDPPTSKGWRRHIRRKKAADRVKKELEATLAAKLGAVKKKERDTHHTSRPWKGSGRGAYHRKSDPTSTRRVTAPTASVTPPTPRPAAVATPPRPTSWTCTAMVSSILGGYKSCGTQNFGSDLTCWTCGAKRPV